MDFSLDDGQVELRDRIRRASREQLNGDLAERDRLQEFSRERWQRCAALGLAGLCIPRGYGGGERNALDTSIALEAFGHGCEDGGLVFAVGAHLLACAVPIARFGSESLRQQHLPRLCDGTWIGANAMTESDAGSDVQAIRTRAVVDGDGFVLDGTKTFVTNGPVADVFVVFAATDRGPTAFVVERTAPGVSVGPPRDTLGLRTTPLGDLTLCAVRLGSTAVLGRVGGGGMVFAHAMTWERIGLFAAHLGAAERTFERAVAHARTRTQSGHAIGDFQAVAHKLAECRIDLEAARLLTYQAAWQLARGRGTLLAAAMAKVAVSTAYVRTAMEALQIHGGAGFLRDAGIERVVRDALGSPIYSGTNEIQKNIIARFLGLGSGR